MVGDDGQGFERRLGKLLRIPAQHVSLDHIVVGGVRKQAPAAGDLAQLKAAVGLLVLNLELGEQRRALAGGDIQCAGQRGRTYRVARHQQQRLEGTFEAICLQRGKG